MLDLRLRVNGREYAGWKTARITRSLECIAGEFELGVTDRWSRQSIPWPIIEEDECEVLLNNEPVITGFVDKRRQSYSSADHSLSVSGRDKTGALVDCSALLTKWEYLSIDVMTFVRKVCAPFDIAVSMQTPLALPKPLTKLTINPGDSAFDALESACRMAGVLAVADGKGGVLLTRAGVARATTALVRGENILSGSGDYDATSRFARYVVMSQQQGSENIEGPAAAAVRGEARDSGVKRSSRVLVVRPESGATNEYAKQRAQWEATVRAARGRSVSYTIQGWTQKSGVLWAPNLLVSVRDSWLNVSGDMLITSVTFTMGEDGQTTDLVLRRADAFTPQPVVKPAGLWKELVT